MGMEENILKSNKSAKPHVVPEKASNKGSLSRHLNNKRHHRVHRTERTIERVVTKTEFPFKERRKKSADETIPAPIDY